MKKIVFQQLLKRLSLQSGEEKLRISFDLSKFVRELRNQGDLYAKEKSAARSRATA